MYVARPGWSPPPSVSNTRIVWRDVSRPNQKRRMIASIIPPGWAAGNSLGVLYLLDQNELALHALLGAINSTTFEFQLRAYLATGHVSLSSLRKGALPPMEQMLNSPQLADLVIASIDGDRAAEIAADAYVAKVLYGLTRSEYRIVIRLFEKLDSGEQKELLQAYDAMADTRR